MNLTPEYITERLLNAIALVRDCDAAELVAQSAGKDMELDSKESMAAIALLEVEFDVEELAGSEDLKPEQLTTLSALGNLIASKLSPPVSEVSHAS